MGFGEGKEEGDGAVLVEAKLEGEGGGVGALSEHGQGEEVFSFGAAGGAEG